MRAVAGPWGETARRIGLRAGELHAALARDRDRPGFRPEPFGELSQRALYQAIRGRFNDAATALRDASGGDRGGLDAAVELEALAVAVDPALRGLLRRPLGTVRTRVHGDLELRHILDTGDDVTIVDFEGSPARPLSERRILRSPVRDLGVLIASFVRVASAGLDEALRRSMLRDAIDPRMEAHLLGWVAAMTAAVLHGHAEAVEGADPALVPRDPDDAALLVSALTIDALNLAIVDEPESGAEGSRLLLPALRAIVERAAGSSGTPGRVAGLPS
jgi:maltose alpha-D-glucosyltransferase/alpha-amylase